LRGSSLVAFEQQIASMREEFLSRAPFSADPSIQSALDSIVEFRQQVSINKDQEVQMQKGLDIFEIEKPPFKDITETAKQLDLLEQVWMCTKEWDETYGGWKNTQFGSLQAPPIHSNQLALV
jgi:dynein heavy chain